MARTAMTELQQQIEAVRREAFAAGYAAAMEAIREATSRAAPGARSAVAAPTRRGRGRGRGRAGRRQQDLASPRRLILIPLQLCDDCAARQRVGAFVFRMAGMAAHPVPLDLVRRRSGFQALP